MTPKEKAVELVEKFNKNDNLYFTLSYYEAVQCALIAVDEIINSLTILFGTIKELFYWQQVKEEINKL